MEGKDGGFEMHDVRKPDLSVGPMTREFVHGPFLRPRHGYGVYPCSASATVFFFLLTITIYVGILLGTRFIPRESAQHVPTVKPDIAHRLIY